MRLGCSGTRKNRNWSDSLGRLANGASTQAGRVVLSAFRAGKAVAGRPCCGRGCRSRNWSTSGRSNVAGFRRGCEGRADGSSGTVGLTRGHEIHLCLPAAGAEWAGGCADKFHSRRLLPKHRRTGVHGRAVHWYKGRCQTARRVEPLALKLHDLEGRVLLPPRLSHQLHQRFFSRTVQCLRWIKARRIFQFRQRLIVAAHRHQARGQRVVILSARIKP